MKPRTQRITRDNMLENLSRVRSELESGELSRDEAFRLLDEAMHVIHRQQESRRVAKRAAEEAAAAAGSLLLPMD